MICETWEELHFQYGRATLELGRFAELTKESVKDIKHMEMHHRLEQQLTQARRAFCEHEEEHGCKQVAASF